MSQPVDTARVGANQEAKQFEEQGLSGAAFAGHGIGLSGGQAQPVIDRDPEFASGFTERGSDILKNDLHGLREGCRAGSQTHVRHRALLRRVRSSFPGCRENAGTTRSSAADHR